jgi:hypothetical protein
MNENTQKVSGETCSIDFVPQDKIRLTTAVACAG